MLAKKFALGFGIAIILPMLVYYGVSTFSPPPKFQEYYPAYIDIGDQKMDAAQRKDVQKERQQKLDRYKSAQKSFSRHLFYTAAPIGVAAILIGAFSSIQAIGTGLMFGGIFTLTTGYLCYWSELADGMRFLSLLIGFIVLMYIGYKKLAK